MSTVVVRPDTEAAVSAWLRGLGQAGDIPDIGKNVFFGAPRSNTYPRVQVTFIASTDNDYIDVLGEDELQLDVVATSKLQACTIARHVAAQVKNLVCGTPLGRDAIGKAGRVVLGPRWQPDDARLAADKKSTVARYVIGARISLVPSA